MERKCGVDKIMIHAFRQQARHGSLIERNFGLEMTTITNESV